MRPIVKTMTCVQITVCPPCGAASTSATTCANTMPTNGTAYAIPAMMPSSSANLKPVSSVNEKTSVPTMKQSAAWPAT